MIRATSIADTAVLEAMHGMAFAPHDAWSAEVIAAQLAAPGGFGLLHPAGGMVLLRVVADEAEILTLAVVPAARCRGVGTALLRAGMDRAAAAGAGCMFLEVGVANQAARRVYGAAGFAEVGVRRRYYSDGTDALVMRAILPQAAGALA